jgi:hypothetical protein
MNEYVNTNGNVDVGMWMGTGVKMGVGMECVCDGDEETRRHKSTMWISG